jgi:hypothetical protein
MRLVWSPSFKPMPNFTNIRNSDNRVYDYVFTSDSGTVLTTSTSTPTNVGINFQLGNIPNASTLQVLFDQYKITCVECWIQPQQNNNGGHTGMLYSAVDYDSSTAISTAAITQYSNVLVSPLTSSAHYHKFVPHVAIAAYNGSFSGFENATAPWIDTSSATVQHYGLLISCPVTTDVIAIDMIVRYHITLRNTL